MMASGCAGACGASVLLIEKNNRLGKKLSITGGRRCNITNAQPNVDLFLDNFPEAKDFLLEPFLQFNVKHTFEFFEGRGLPLMVEDRRRAFPESEKAEDVCDVLADFVEESGNVDVMLNTTFKSFIFVDGVLEGIDTSRGTFRGSKIILATGGLAAPETGSTGEGLSLLASIGHTVKDPDPSMVPLKSPTEWVHNLSGTTVDEATLRFVQNGEIKHSVEGRILFTHFGISGPTVINVARIVKELFPSGSVTASLDLFPRMSAKQMDDMFKRMFEKSPKKLLKGVLRDVVQTKLANTIMDTMDPYIGDLKVSSVSKVQRKRVIDTLKSLNFPITDTMGLSWSIVADGGVSPGEVDFANMTSKLYPNLYLIGDTLNINRPSGGFSLQLCWTTGWIAGTHAGTCL